MYRFKRLLVGVSFAQQDGASIRYAAMISKLAKSEKIIFLHVASNMDIPEDLLKEYPDLFQPVDTYAREEMKTLVKKYFDGYKDTQIEYKVLEGSPLIEFLRAAKDEDVDLIVMRKRKEPTGSGSLFEKIARKAPCSVLFVPESSKAWYDNILVPTDFSENSRDAMHSAISIALASSGIKTIHCLHVYKVPLGYYKTGKSYEEFAEIMKGHAEKYYQEFIEKIDLKGLTATPIFKLEKDEAKGIEDVIKEGKFSLLIIGAKGRKAGSGVLLGSVTEHLINTTTIPLLAIKKKGAGLGLLDALLKL
ncbi:MAG: universal stress protein [Deltaproteobacteria bacterium]|nr:universal stress protein [Deltaproteobacteria bacterium]